MPASPWLLALLFLAVAIGFLLGRFDRLSLPRRRQLRPSHLALRLGEPTDQALRAMLDNLDCSPEEIDTPLALGRLYRKRGELDRATLIHQRMLDNKHLPESVQEDVELELARDFLAAGLLDRAEPMLQHIADRGGRHAPTAMRQLMSIFEQERDWHSALALGERLLRRQGDIAQVLAQYCCELAERLLEQEPNAARRLLGRALALDAQCVRASLLQGRLEISTGQWENALRALRRIRRQNPAFLDQALDSLERCYQALGREDDMLSFLLEACLAAPSSLLVVKLGQVLRARVGAQEATQFLAQYMKQVPSLQGLHEIVAMNLGQAEGSTREHLDTLHQLTGLLLARRVAYQCNQCGFSARALHWQCPGCKRWATVAPAPSAVV